VSFSSSAAHSDMSVATQELTDITVHGPRTRMRGVRAANVELRPWIANFPVCQALNQYQILHIGIQEAFAPTRIVRTKQTTTYFLACYAGRGRVLIDGRWRTCREGFACLLPAHTLNAFECVPRSGWEFCWVCYQRPTEQRPIAEATTPVMARFEALPLRSAILGLMYECNGPAQPTLIQEWCDLIHAYVLRFAQPTNQPDQLRLLWERVASNLAEPWTLARLAHEAGYSKEHLRRLCRACERRPSCWLLLNRPLKPSRCGSDTAIRLSSRTLSQNGLAGALPSTAARSPGPTIQE
jgi:AraC-like DNA-binding protein